MILKSIHYFENQERSHENVEKAHDQHTGQK